MRKVETLKFMVSIATRKDVWSVACCLLRVRKRAGSGHKLACNRASGPPRGLTARVASHGGTLLAEGTTGRVNADRVPSGVVRVSLVSIIPPSEMLDS